VKRNTAEISVHSGITVLSSSKWQTMRTGAVHIVSALSVHTVVQFWACRWNWAYRPLDKCNSSSSIDGQYFIELYVIYIGFPPGDESSKEQYSAVRS
jgi:hypothetical protein